MAYHDLDNTMKLVGGFENVRMEIPKSEFAYVQVYDKVLRFGHGDHFKFGGGIGGLAVPLQKFLYRANQIKHADMTFIGHWHQSIKPTSNCIVNGSVIGYGAYAYSLQATPETPQQQFQLLDKKRGFTVNTVIQCV
jgi:hypothetical protein